MNIINKLSLKQKMLVGIITIILISLIGIYGYTSNNNEKEEIDINQMLDVQSIPDENIQQNDEKGEVIENENTKEDKKEIVIHITGEVKNKGIILLKKGDRIADAIEAAGGLTKEADVDQINLAYLLEDGQKIYIPNKKDKELKEEKVYITSESGNNVIIENIKGGENKKVNINVASQSELETLPGIGPSIASRIIEYREQNGKFKSIEDLQNVKGIVNSKFENVRDYIMVK